MMTLPLLQPLRRRAAPSCGFSRRFVGVTPTQAALRAARRRVGAARGLRRLTLEQRDKASERFPLPLPQQQHPLDVIELRGLTFYAKHGVYAEEEYLGQQFVVDVELGCDTRAAAASDSLANAVNYSSVYQQVKSAVQDRRFKLVESLADSIARSILQENVDVVSIKVSVKKPHVPIPGILDYCGVTIHRDRSHLDFSRGSDASSARKF